MQYRDGDAMDLTGIAEVHQSGQKIPKKAFINVIKDAYRLLDKNQVWSFDNYSTGFRSNHIKGANYGNLFLIFTEFFVNLTSQNFI